MNSNSFHKYRQQIGKNLRYGIRGYFTEYETPKLVLIHSLRFAVLLRMMQIIILSYSIVYLLIYEKGYQKQDTAIISSATLKMKGIGYARTSRNRTVVVDVADYIIPPSENGAIFIMTNFIQTDQKRLTCPESATLKEAECKTDSHCQNRPFSPKINGHWTGRCLQPLQADVRNGTIGSTKNSTGLCEYSGWCPAEDDQSPTMLVQGVLNFTIFIKNFIEFPAFNVKHQNMVDELKTCIFHPEKSKDCPIFRLSYIINQAEKDPEERRLMLRSGGVIRVKLDWNCNLDRKLKHCKPEYSFARLDVPFRDKPFSVGFNFRYGSHWKHNETNFRTLTKAFGLRLIISVSGKAGKFHFITFSLNAGSLVGIFGLATFLCDLILLRISKQARLYRNHVFEVVHIRTLPNTVNMSNETVVKPIKSRRKKTVVIRPMSLMNSEQLKSSESI